MRQTNVLKEKMAEAVKSVLPLTVIISVLCILLIPMKSGVYLGFLVGAVLVTVGIGLFTLGSEIAMTPMGEYIGASMAKSRNTFVIVVLSFFIGALITISEPDLLVLAEQVSAIPSTVLIFAVAAGVGVFLVVAMLRVLFKVKLRYILLVCYLIIFIMAVFVDPDFWTVAFDAGGVTTGPMTVPFLMTLGVGVASIRSDNNGEGDSFGYVALCSVGPIMAVMIIGLFGVEPTGDEASIIPDYADVQELGLAYLKHLPAYIWEVLKALLPIALFFYLYQWIRKPMSRANLLRIAVGLLYTIGGLILFLVGANVGFMPAGQFIGEAFAASRFSWLLIPVGMVIGYFIVAAEPAIHVLEQQVEEVTAGAIPRRALSVTLGCGVALSVGIAMLRALTGISVMWFLIPGYAIALILMFFVDDTFSSIAFDSGGVASGPMTATFLLTMSIGATTKSGGNVMTDAFGVVAMVAMTPLIAIQILGLVYRIKRARRTDTIMVTAEMIAAEEVIDF